MCGMCVCVCDVWCVSEGCVIVLKRGRVTGYLAIKMCAMVEVCVCVQNVQSVLCVGQEAKLLSYKCVQQLTKFSLTLGCRCVRG